MSAPLLAGVVAGGGVVLVGWSLRQATAATARRRLPMAEPSSVAHAVELSERWSSRWVDAGLGGDPARLATLAIAVLGVAALLSSLVAAPIVGLLVVAAAVGGVPVLASVLDERAHRRAVVALPEAMDATARSLRSGATLRWALADAGRAVPEPLAGDLRGVAADADAGLGLDAALARWADRRSAPEVRLAASAIALAAEAGGAQAAAIEGLAETMRDQVAARAEARAWAAQAQLSAVVIGVAPVAFMVFTTVTDPRVADFLFRSTLGWVVLVAGLGLDVVAALWMRRLARVEV